MSRVSYIGVRDAAVEQIRAAFAPSPQIHVEAHPGNFDEKEIRRLAQKTPLVTTALMRIGDMKESDNSYCDFLSCVLVRASQKDKLYDAALKIVSFLIPVIRGLDTDRGYDTRDIQAECLYSGALDDANATLWAVKWRWKVRADSIGESPDDAGILLMDDLENFEGFDATHTVGEQTAKDTVELEV
jgi:hypothetical protein